jgi:hypothetical protein
MVAEDFLRDPQVRQWLDGVEPAWTQLTFESLCALQQEPSAVQAIKFLLPPNSYSNFSAATACTKRALSLNARRAISGPGRLRPRA